MPSRQPAAPSALTANDTAVVPQADGNPTNLRHCTRPGCGRPFYARGLCFLHYQRWRQGRPLDGRRRRPRLPDSFKVFRG